MRPFWWPPSRWPPFNQNDDDQVDAGEPNAPSAENPNDAANMVSDVDDTVMPTWSPMNSTWARLVLAMGATIEARLKLETAELQQAKSGRGLMGIPACAEAYMIVSVHHNAEMAVKAHDKLYLCSIVAPTAIWKAAALALRENVIMHCCCHAGGGAFQDIEAKLLEMYGVDRFGPAGGDHDLRAQLHKCFDHICPGTRNLHKHVRARRNRQVDAGEPNAPAAYSRADSEFRIIARPFEGPNWRTGVAIPTYYNEYVGNLKAKIAEKLNYTPLQRWSMQLETGFEGEVMDDWKTLADYEFMLGFLVRVTFDRTHA
jgi:hypothetical protein